jgi:hypothetical protein
MKTFIGSKANQGSFMTGLPLLGTYLTFSRLPDIDMMSYQQMISLVSMSSCRSQCCFVKWHGLRKKMMPKAYKSINLVEKRLSNGISMNILAQS